MFIEITNANMAGTPRPRAFFVYRQPRQRGRGLRLRGGGGRLHSAAAALGDKDTAPLVAAAVLPRMLWAAQGSVDTCASRLRGRAAVG